MNKKNIIVRLEVLVLAIVMLAVSNDATIYRHHHNGANGANIVHSHYFPLKIGDNRTSHNHTASQFQFLDQVCHLLGFTPLIALEVVHIDHLNWSIIIPLQNGIAAIGHFGICQLRGPPSL